VALNEVEKLLVNVREVQVAAEDTQLGACPICFDALDKVNYPLQACGHRACKDCWGHMLGYITEDM
jgi:Zinc finger, C3HC4 type (RING finger)